MLSAIISVSKGKEKASVHLCWPQYHECFHWSQLQWPTCSRSVTKKFRGKVKWLICVICSPSQEYIHAFEQNNSTRSTFEGREVFYGCGIHTLFGDIPFSVQHGRLSAATPTQEHFCLPWDVIGPSYNVLFTLKCGTAIQGSHCCSTATVFVWITCGRQKRVTIYVLDCRHPGSTYAVCKFTRQMVST